MESGKIVEWLKKEGEEVKEGEALVRVEGEKTIFTVEAPESGILGRILAREGEEVPVTEPIAIITSPGEEITEEVIPKERIRASPAAKRLAEKYGVDLSRIKGTGPGGRIIKEDMLRAIEEIKEKKAEIKIRKIIKIEGMRRTIARRLSESHRTIPAVAIVMEVDMSKALDLKRKLKEKHQNVSITAIIVKATAKALEQDLMFNSSVKEDKIVVYDEINIGVAVSLPDGLVVPVIRNANKKTLMEISREIETLSNKARKEGLSPEDVAGGTFTVSNLGTKDVEFFTPIINPPQAAILGVGTISSKPISIEGKVEIRPMMYISLVFDHRVADGVPASEFLRKIKKNLENPQILLE